jgi:hypothetical protein
MGSWETSVYLPIFSLTQRLMPFNFVAGAGKSVLWYVTLSIVSFRRLTESGKLADHRGYRGFAKIWACITGYLLL